MVIFFNEASGKNNFIIVLRMLANYVGEDKFLKGVSIYLKKKLYGNSVTKDLWQGISEATGRLGILRADH
jgi:hypothetical protein